MASRTLWSNSATKIIELASPDGCRLAAPRLLGVDRPKRPVIIKGDDLKRLVQAGLEKAINGRRRVLLRLTGQRGRPQERILLPPRPASKRVVALGLRQEIKTRTKSARKLRHEFSEQTKVKNKVEELEAIVGKVGNKVDDIDGKVQRLSEMVEGMRQKWREDQNLPPKHPALPMV